MNQISNYLLTLVLVYGYPLIGGIVLAGGLGVPLPISTLLVAAGSFTSLSDTNIDYLTLLIIVTVAAITGDVLGYMVGRKYGPRFFSKNKSNYSFLKKWGAWCIFITRVLLTPLGVPINLVAGSQKYPFIKFFWIALLGEFLWAFIYITIGHYFGASWVTIYAYLNGTPQIAALIAVGAVLLYVSMKMRKRKS